MGVGVGVGGCRDWAALQHPSALQWNDGEPTGGNPFLSHAPFASAFTRVPALLPACQASNLPAPQAMGEKRFETLNGLLQKSEMYTKFLVEQMKDVTKRTELAANQATKKVEEAEGGEGRGEGWKQSGSPWVRGAKGQVVWEGGGEGGEGPGSRCRGRGGRIKQCPVAGHTLHSAAISAYQLCRRCCMHVPYACTRVMHAP